MLTGVNSKGLPSRAHLGADRRVMTRRFQASTASCMALAVTALLAGLSLVDRVLLVPATPSSNSGPVVPSTRPTTHDAPRPARARSTVSLPAAFIENRGQWDLPAQYVLQRGATTAFAEAGALVRWC